MDENNSGALTKWRGLSGVSPTLLIFGGLCCWLPSAMSGEKSTNGKDFHVRLPATEELQRSREAMTPGSPDGTQASNKGGDEGCVTIQHYWAVILCVVTLTLCVLWSTLECILANGRLKRITAKCKISKLFNGKSFPEPDTYVSHFACANFAAEQLMRFDLYRMYCLMRAGVGCDKCEGGKTHQRCDGWSLLHFKAKKFIRRNTIGMETPQQVVEREVREKFNTLSDTRQATIVQTFENPSITPEIPTNDLNCRIAMWYQQPDPIGVAENTEADICVLDPDLISRIQKGNMSLQQAISETFGTSCYINHVTKRSMAQNSILYHMVNRDRVKCHKLSYAVLSTLINNHPVNAYRMLQKMEHDQNCRSPINHNRDECTMWSVLKFKPQLNRKGQWETPHQVIIREIKEKWKKLVRLTTHALKDELAQATHSLKPWESELPVEMMYANQSVDWSQELLPLYASCCQLHDDEQSLQLEIQGLLVDPGMWGWFYELLNNKEELSFGDRDWRYDNNIEWGMQVEPARVFQEIYTRLMKRCIQLTTRQQKLLLIGIRYKEGRQVAGPWVMKLQQLLNEATLDTSTELSKLSPIQLSKVTVRPVDSQAIVVKVEEPPPPAEPAEKGHANLVL